MARLNIAEVVRSSNYAAKPGALRADIFRSWSILFFSAGYSLEYLSIMLDTLGLLFHFFRCVG